MTGAEHYREAERLLRVGHGWAATQAQVHATLALAAATAHAAGADSHGDMGSRWDDSFYGSGA